MDTHRAREDAWSSDSPLENPPPRPPFPKSFLRTLCLRCWESCWEVWPMGNRELGSVACGKSRGPLSGREGFCFPEQVRRDPVKLL